MSSTSLSSKMLFACCDFLDNVDFVFSCEKHLYRQIHFVNAKMSERLREVNCHEFDFPPNLDDWTIMFPCLLIWPDKLGKNKAAELCP